MADLILMTNDVGTHTTIEADALRALILYRAQVEAEENTHG